MGTAVGTIALERFLLDHDSSSSSSPCSSSLLNLIRTHHPFSSPPPLPNQQPPQHPEDEEEEKIGDVCPSLPFLHFKQPQDDDELFSNHTDFSDAHPDFLSDSSVSNAFPPFRPNIDVEMKAARVNLFDEIERRKRAENELARMASQWQKMKTHVSQLGLSFPSARDARIDPELDMESVEQFCQEVVVIRAVSEAIGRVQARAETEAAAELIIESKVQEISRLHTRVNYYEAVNLEMSRRNQEIVEMARRHRLKSRTKRKWMWTCIGLSLTLGALVAYSHNPETSRHISNETSGAASDML